MKCKNNASIVQPVLERIAINLFNGMTIYYPFSGLFISDWLNTSVNLL